MNDGQKSEGVTLNKSRLEASEYSYLLKASELVEIAKCRPPAEAVELIADELRGLAKPQARTNRRFDSGFRHRSEDCPGLRCSSCGDDERRLYKHGRSLDCADCIMIAMLGEKYGG